MRLVVLGLSLSSSWGNGHATTYRSLLRAFAARGHQVLFLEREQPWYAAHRDLPQPDFCDLRFYDAVSELSAHRAAIAHADAVLVGSFVPDGMAVGDLVQIMARGATAFYDIDTPVTLAALERGECSYLRPEQIPGYDLYLSFTGGPTLDRLMTHYGSPAARPLYCCADEALYRPGTTPPRYELGYLGTYSPDRQPTLDALLLEPARRAPGRRFIVAGPQYPTGIDWPANVERVEHVPPAEHAAFYGACRYTLNVTRADMRRAGWSPSVRLFEAGACGAAILSDAWPGIEDVLTPGRDIALVTRPEEVLARLAAPDAERQAMGEAARRRVLAAHTATHRAGELERHLECVRPAARSCLSSPLPRGIDSPAVTPEL